MPESLTPERWHKVKDILQSCLDAPPAERARILDEACGGDAGIRGEVESLLASYEEAGDFLQDSPLGARQPGRGEQFGVYQIVQKIGEGGMGVVYQGVRNDDQFRKLVAIKVVKRGMDTDYVLERFHNERQILAHFDHPNIAKLLDGGVTGDGRPYVVMEFIAGLPIDEYCDAAAPEHPGAPGAVSEGLLRGGLRSSEPGGASRSQTAQRAGHRERRAAPAGFRHRQDAGRRSRGDHPRHAHDDAGLRQSGADARRPHHHGQRRLLAGRAALRTALRTSAVPAQGAHARGGGPDGLPGGSRPAQHGHPTAGRGNASGKGRTRHAHAGTGEQRAERPSGAAAQATGRRPRQHRADGDAQGAAAPLSIGGTACRGHPPAHRGPAGDWRGSPRSATGRRSSCAATRPASLRRCWCS